MKYASKLGKMNLVDKIAEVVTYKMEEKERGLQNGHVDTYTSRYSISTYCILQGLVWMWLFKLYHCRDEGSVNIGFLGYDSI